MFWWVRSSKRREKLSVGNILTEVDETVLTSYPDSLFSEKRGSL